MHVLIGGSIGGTGTPSKNHKMIGFHRNTGPGPLKNYKATHPAVNVGSPLA